MYETQSLFKRRIKKSILLLFAAILFPVLLYADAANIIFTAGGNVKAMNSESIKMVKEKINITMLGNHFEVRVDYVFYNSGEKQTAIMGFPNSRGTYGSPENPEGIQYGINDFRAFDGKKELKIERKETAVTKSTKAFSVWETFMVDFEAGETKNVTNIYSQKYWIEHGGSKESAEYILTTGATWKGLIDSIWVNIHSNLPNFDLHSKTAYVLEESGDDRWYSKDVYYGLYVFPQEYILEGNVIKMQFTNIEPDFNIKITPPPSSRISASSELDKDKNNKYTAWNLIDGDPSTAWVEGRNGSGINEYFEFYFPVEYTDMVDLYAAFKIDSLGIINGYAKNEGVFYNNNRVKKIKIEYTNDIFREENPYNMKAPESIEFILEDTMDMQYLAFPESIYMSSMKISILEVYKGSKWDDTCISELRIFSSE